ncbi:MAG: hypothetical protein DDT32_00931 [Syntrophomonadaceae bacterium]|nr:hypothetical protein [Bacillota bacterium]MBT9147179.1 hypothetical protein [Bacillota bacterium]
MRILRIHCTAKRAPLSARLVPSITKHHWANVLCRRSLQLARRDRPSGIKGQGRRWVWHIIARARVVICDCSGRNPNVFYEVGIAHALGREVILITQSENDIPFDLRHIRYISYLNNNEGLLLLEEAVQSRIRTLVGSL